MPRYLDIHCSPTTSATSKREPGAMRNLSLTVALFSLAACTHEVDLNRTTAITAAGVGKSGAPALTVSTPPIRINDVVPRGSGPDGWVELYNPTASAIELGHWTVTSADVLRSFILPAGATIPPHGFLVIDEASDFLIIESREGSPNGCPL